MRPPWSGIRQGARNPVVTGRKFCPRCGRWRHVCDFGVKRHPRQSGRVLPRSYCMTCQERSNIAAVARRTEEQRERRREYNRIWTEVRRRQAGVKPRPFNYEPANRRRRKTPIDRQERIMLDPAPLVKLLREITEKGQQKELARRAGLQTRTLHRLMVGESRHVRIDVADRLAVALGVPLALLYEGTA